MNEKTACKSGLKTSPPGEWWLFAATGGVEYDEVWLTPTPTGNCRMGNLVRRSDCGLGSFALLRCRKLKSQMIQKIRYKIRGLWDMTRDALEVERRRLESGVTESEIIQGTTVCSYFFICDGDAWEVLRGAREVIGIVNEISLGDGWPSDEDWRNLLPQWFVDACAAEDEPVEDGPYPSTFEERRTRFFNEKWKVSNWVSWMEPEDRRWLWLDAEVRDADTLLVHIDLVSDPGDLGAPPGVWWMFAAAGALKFDEIRKREDTFGYYPDGSNEAM